MTSPRHTILGILALLTPLLTSCSENPALSLRYQAEKKYFQAEKAHQELRDHSRPLSATELGGLMVLYKDAADFTFAAMDSVDATVYPAEFSELKYLAYKASWQLAQIQLTARQFDSSVQTLNRLITDIQPDESQLLQTCLRLGQTLQIAGRWDSARAVYNFTIEEFYPPLDNLGELITPALNLPGHLYLVVLASGDSVAAAREFKRAESYYRKLIQDHPGTKLAAAGHRALAELYDKTRQWQKEVNELAAVVDPASPNYRDISLRMADLLGGRLRKFDTALTIYDNLSGSLSPEDSSLKPMLRFKTALVKMDQKRFGETRDIINSLKEEYPRYFDSTPMLQYTLARSLELEGKWERAETEYSLLIEKFGGTDEAMMTHLYMLDYLRAKGRTVEAQRWYESAEKHFDDAAYRGRGTAMEAKALFYKAELSRRNKDFNRAAEILVSVFAKFPTSEPGQKALEAAADLYRIQLDNPVKADSLLSQLRRHLSNIAGGLENKDLLTD